MKANVNLGYRIMVQGDAIWNLKREIQVTISGYLRVEEGYFHLFFDLFSAVTG